MVWLLRHLTLATGVRGCLGGMILWSLIAGVFHTGWTPKFPRFHEKLRSNLPSRRVSGAPDRLRRRHQDTLSAVMGTKFEVFRELHERPGIFAIPNPWDAGSARILTALGFEALATTSAGYAFSAGRRDLPSALSREDVLANARAIVEATHLPVSADLQNGFGDSPEECALTIRMASETGLAGGSVEDSTGDGNAPIYEFEHAVERVAAASEAARKASFLLTARAEGFLWGRPDLDEIVRRLRAFSAAGADVLYAPGLSNLESIRTVCSAVDKPVNVLAGFGGLSMEQLAEAGVKRVSVGGSLARAAMNGFLQAAREIREKGTFTYASGIVSHQQISAYMPEPVPKDREPLQ